MWREMKAAQYNLEHKYAERIEGTEGGGVISSLVIKYSAKKECGVVKREYKKKR